MKTDLILRDVDVDYAKTIVKLAEWLHAIEPDDVPGGIYMLPGDVLEEICVCLEVSAGTYADWAEYARADAPGRPMYPAGYGFLRIADILRATVAKLKEDNVDLLQAEARAGGWKPAAD
jgi:hypothetical protein